jgi:hypothetical protein
MYSVLSAFTSSPNSLLDTTKVSAFSFMLCTLQALNLALEKNMNQILNRERRVEDRYIAAHGLPEFRVLSTKCVCDPRGSCNKQ